MRRFEPVIVYKTADMSESPDGLYVLHSEAQAEIDRLRGLVEKAYAEGWSAYDDRDNKCDCWDRSEARKSLTPPSPTPNQQ